MPVKARTGFGLCVLQEMTDSVSVSPVSPSAITVEDRHPNDRRTPTRWGGKISERIVVRPLSLTTAWTETRRSLRGAVPIGAGR